jgi:alpha-L-arabinofuranosidase
MNQLDPYIQDALDLIEFANGPSDSKWGKIRAEMGHPSPFNLKMMGIGNEQWDVQYVERYKAFAKVLKEKYPNVKLITSAGPSPDGKQFEYLSGEMKNLHADFVDEHYYKEPSWFLTNTTRYDKYERNGPKIFAGEYAAHSKAGKEAESRNNWESALAEAAFMTGLERNADVVQMASYAPLFGNVEAWQWRPDLIWFDNLRVAGSPNYYVQKLFSTNKGTNVIPMLRNGAILAGSDSIYGSAVIDKKSNEIIVKLVNTSSKNSAFEIAIEGSTVDKKPLISEVLSASNPAAFNSLDKPSEIATTTTTIKPTGNKIKIISGKGSVTVVKVPCKKL